MSQEIMCLHNLEVHIEINFRIKKSKNLLQFVGIATAVKVLTSKWMSSFRKKIMTEVRDQAKNDVKRIHKQAYVKCSGSLRNFAPTYLRILL